MDQKKAAATYRQTRLDSWKAIAQYLDRSSRTAQRWHRKYRLPVRHLGVETGSVFAYANELDQWLQNRNETARGAPAELATLMAIRDPQFDHSSGNPFSLSTYPNSWKEQSAALASNAYRLWEEFSSPNLRMITGLLREAIDLDPHGGEVFARLSHVLIMKDLMASSHTPAAYRSAKAALKRAIEIDPELPETGCGAAWLNMLLDRDWEAARNGFDSILNRRSSCIQAVVGRALLYIAEGRQRDASVLLLDVVIQNPLNSRNAALYCWSKYLAGDYEEALSLAEDAQDSGQSGLVLDAVEALACIRCERPDAFIRRIEALLTESANHELLLGVLAYAFAMSGQASKAAEIAGAVLHRAAEGKGDPYAAALVLSGLNETNDAVQWLEQSFREGSLWSLGFPSDPALKALRDEPSYRKFLKDAHYPTVG